MKKPITRTVTEHKDYLKVLVKNTSAKLVRCELVDKMKRNVGVFDVRVIKCSEHLSVQYTQNVIEEWEDGHEKSMYSQASINPKQVNLNKGCRIKGDISHGNKVSTHVLANTEVEYIFYYRNK